MFIRLTSCQSDFNHLAFVMQWPPTLCGYSGVHCKPTINRQRFTMHGVWPGNSTGHSLKCILSPQHSEDYVKDVMRPSGCVSGRCTATAQNRHFQLPITFKER
ncbi:hypothetical protein AABB24_028984 [Solanum stoloniferum]|uniref:Uncharacterized protein n=2 Tax=Solanum stoloniferum TaxID=62892 RepID=A0ABD2S9M1_9SOLN